MTAACPQVFGAPPYRGRTLKIHMEAISDQEPTFRRSVTDQDCGGLPANLAFGAELCKRRGARLEEKMTRPIRVREPGPDL